MSSEAVAVRDGASEDRVRGTAGSSVPGRESAASVGETHGRVFKRGLGDRDFWSAQSQQNDKRDRDGGDSPVHGFSSGLTRLG